MEEGDLRKRIAQIQQDATLSDAEKAKKRQELLSGRWKQAAPEPDKGSASTGTSEIKIVLTNAHCWIDVSYYNEGSDSIWRVCSRY